jgi:magnesium transporter
VEARLITATSAEPVPEEALREAIAADRGVVWVDMDHTDKAGMALLQEMISVRAGDLQDCYTRTPVPKIHVYADHLFSAINGVARGGDGRLHFQPLKVFLNTHLVVTVLGPTHSALTADAARRELAAVRQRLDAPGFNPSTGLDLVTAIRFQMLHAQEEMIGVAAARVAALEQRIIVTDPVRAESLLQELVEVRHDLQTIGTNAAQTHESYVQLIDMLDNDRALLPMDVRRIHELRQGFSHLKNTTDLEREYLQEMLDLFQTRASTELNSFVRQITAWGTIGIAWTVIAGIYGMNFVNMPELHWRYGYPYAIGLMILISAALGLVFRRKHWL